MMPGEGRWTGPYPAWSSSLSPSPPPSLYHSIAPALLKSEDSAMRTEAKAEPPKAVM